KPHGGKITHVYHVFSELEICPLSNTCGKMVPSLFPSGIIIILVNIKTEMGSHRIGSLTLGNK
ncbi:MAG TPA: hypothetical protein VK085_02610, partial [Pseudogracilibacillus sp.]|nr:hypothetical protein [Pseudogracilibacillus sp.]